MATVGQTIDLQIDKPAAGGRMIARAGGQIVFVAGAIPGERVTARVTRVAKGVLYADCIAVEEASADRRVPFTDLACGGSAYAHIEYQRQLTIKSDIIADGLTRIGRLAPPAPIQVAASPSEGYRMRARLHVQGGQVGFYREGSHDLCDPRSTRQLLPETCGVLEQIATCLRQPHFDGVRELEITENVEATTRAVHLISSSPLTVSKAVGLEAVTGMTGATLTASAAAGQAPETHLITGDPYVTDRVLIGGVDGADAVEISLRRHVRAFFQGNRYLLAPLASHVTALVPRAVRMIDLYAGVGLFAAAAAASCEATVAAVEGDPYAARDLAINVARLPGVEVYHEAVEAFLSRRRERPEVVILDPPRTGLSAEALSRLIACAAPRLIYVSCDVATLSRDARALVASGYEVTRVDGFDLFPNTPHVETVMELVRR